MSRKMSALAGSTGLSGVFEAEVDAMRDGEAVASRELSDPDRAGDGAGIARATDGRGSDATGSESAGDEPANDNPPGGPSPTGGPAVVGPARSHDPDNVILRSSLVDEARASRSASLVRLATYLVRRLDAGEGLPSLGNRPAIGVIARQAGIRGASVARDTPCRRLLERYAPLFRLEIASPDGHWSRPDRTQAVRDLVSRFIEEGRAVPITARGAVSWDGIGAEVGVEGAVLSRYKPAREPIEEALRSGALVKGGIYVPPVSMTEAEIEERVAALATVVRGFDVEGGRIPESPIRRGLIDWEHIASLTGRTHPTMERHPAYRKMVREVADRRGLLPAGLSLGEDTLASLLAAGLERVRTEQTARNAKAVSATVANHKSAFDRIVAASGLDYGEPAVALFRENVFEDRVALAVAGMENSRSSSNLRRLLGWWRTFHLTRVGAAELPESFADTLKLLMARRGLNMAALARAAACPSWIIENWAKGKRVSAAQVEILDRVELALGLSHGVLRMRTEHVFTGSAHRRVATEAYNALDKLVRPLLPPEAMQWPEDRLAAAVAQVSPLVGKGTAYSEMFAAALLDENRLPVFDLPARLESQIDDYVAYKTAEVSYPLLRPKGARWKSASSVKMRRRELEAPYRFFAAPPPDADAKLGGLGIEAELHTAAWLAHPPLAFAFVGHRVGRLSHVLIKGECRGNVYGSVERAFIQHLVSLTNPVSGWFVQHPELADTLVPLEARLVPGRWDDLLRLFTPATGGLLLSAEDVRFARRDWTAFVSRAHAAYLQALSYVDDVMEVSRNPLEPVRGLVECAEPQAELMYLLFEAERRWADERTSPLAYRLDVRDAVLHRLAAATAFRPSNLVNLTYTGDEMGEIRRVDGVWVIEIGYRKFKNYGNCRLFGTRTARRDYRAELRDEAGLYQLLDRYFEDVLPAMRLFPETNSAWLSRVGRPLTARTLWDVVRAFGRKHIAHNPVLGTGFPGVISINPYCFRHIKASDTLKNGVSLNRLEEAAFALQTSELMIQRHYGLLLPEEATRSSFDTFARAVALAKRRQG